MIESLKYVATFNSTGRTLKNQLSFKPGITVIKGENEAGKSFILEMIRYALFGSDALRGLKSDYAKLEVTLKLRIKGKLFTIVRNGNKASVNQTEAVGTKAVNSYIIRQLGFGLTVFDIACNAKQGQLDRLTEDMAPTERRKMVDDVTGLSQFERIERECRDEVNAFRKVVDALSAQLIEPEKPVKPRDYEPSEVLQKRLDQQIRNETLRATLPTIEEPKKPVKPVGAADAIDHEREREADERQRQSIKIALAKLPKPDFTYNLQTLKGFKLSLEQDARGPRPRMLDPKQLEQWRHDNIILASDEGPLKCPNCGEIVQGKELPELPPMTLAEIEAEINAQHKWEGYEYVKNLPASPLSTREIDLAIAAIDAVRDRTVLENQLRELGSPMVDRSEEAAAWLEYEESLKEYDRAKGAYKSYLMKKAEIDKLPPAEPFLREKLDMALRYETLMSRYDALYEAYDTMKGRVEQADTKKEGYKRGAEALKDARKDVKRYLIPSLSKVSSHLLREMTDGERRTIKIDEDFEIYVDNQHVRTLSGSGVSVVNLALRIALGQVLTQSVIPFFLADEIDANMAERRTKATHDSLRRLKSQLKQIIVVTHKDFEGDHTICLN